MKGHALDAAAGILFLVSVAAQVDCGGMASQENDTAGIDASRSGWAPASANLSADRFDPTHLGVRFRVPLKGTVMGQPLVHAGAVYVATDRDSVYSLDSTTGSTRWTRSVGRSEPAGAGAAFSCEDVAPSLGVLSTPVIDPGTALIYLVSRNWDGAQPSSGAWVVHALRLADGAEAPGWPITLVGTAAGEPSDQFEGTTLLQRAALAISHGRLWIAFAGACDHYPFRGWLASIGLQDRRLALWPLSPGDPGGGAGIWQSGGGPADDGAGGLLLSTGDGNPQPMPSARNPLAQCVLRLRVDASTPSVTDRYCPVDAAALDRLDLDVGTSNPLPLPVGFGAGAGAGAGRMVVQVSKDGVVYLLDRDHLATPLASSPGHEPMLSRPAASPLDGLVFVTGTPIQLPGRPPPPEARLRAYRVVGGSLPAIREVASAAEPLSYGSGSPLVTSDGRRPGSAMVWIVARQDILTNRPAELRAYDARPEGRLLRLRFLRQIGTAAKFSQPATDGSHIYVVTGDGELLAFGSGEPGPMVPVWLVGALAAAALLAAATIAAVRRGRR